MIRRPPSVDSATITVQYVPQEYIPCLLVRFINAYSRSGSIVTQITVKKLTYILQQVDKRLVAAPILVSVVYGFLEPDVVYVGGGKRYRKRYVYLSRDKIPEYFARVGRSVDCGAWDRILVQWLEKPDMRFVLKVPPARQG